MSNVDESLRNRGRSVVIVPGAGRVIPLGEAGDVTLKAVGDETGGTMSAYEFVAPPARAGPPHHLHRNWDEALSVLAGVMTFLIDGQTRTAPAGTFVFIPRGVLHTFWSESDAPARQLTVFTPSGIEHYFADATQALAGGGDEALEAAMTLMEKHDMVVPRDARPAYERLDPAD